MFAFLIPHAVNAAEAMTTDNAPDERLAGATELPWGSTPLAPLAIHSATQVPGTFPE